MPNYQLYLVNTVGMKNLPPGDYEFDIILHDTLDPGSSATQTLPFTIIPLSGGRPRPLRNRPKGRASPKARPAPRSKDPPKAKAKGEVGPKPKKSRRADGVDQWTGGFATLAGAGSAFLSSNGLVRRRSVSSASVLRRSVGLDVGVHLLADVELRSLQFSGRT